MPHYFPNTIRAMLKGRTVRMAHMVELDFDTTSGFAPAYLWNGSRDIVSGGKTWVGMRQLGSITGLDETVNGVATEIKAGLSGVDAALMQLAVSENKAHYVGRLLRVWLQFFDADFQMPAPLDEPYARAAGLMDGMEVSRQQRDDGATVRTVSVTASNIFAGRRQSPYGYWTDRDQKARHPGDRGLEFVTQLQSAEIPIPWLAPGFF